jgi:transcriptional regulator with XRE-family HTH domain
LQGGFVLALDYEHIGARIKYFRKKAHLSQEELAELTELSRVFIGFVERGEKTPSIESIVSIANALNVSADDLLFGNLIVSNSPHYAPEYELLADCTSEETDIILKCMAYLKEQLRGYRITK